jgi:cell wall-associated NlpC family hydrolase
MALYFSRGSWSGLGEGMKKSSASKGRYSIYQFGFELLFSWALLYFLFPMAYFKADYLIRKHQPGTLLNQVSAMGLEDFTVLAEEAAAAGADELASLMAEVDKLQAKASYEGYSVKGVGGPGPATTATLSGPSGATRADLVSTSKRYIGTPYRWGGQGPGGFDCSGYVQYVYRRAAGVELPRSSSEQYASGRGRFVGRNSLQPGDLVFFATSGRGVSHVGLYLGNNQFIHAPSSGNLVRIDSLNDPYYWRDRYVGAKSFI